MRGPRPPRRFTLTRSKTASGRSLRRRIAGPSRKPGALVRVASLARRSLIARLRRPAAPVGERGRGQGHRRSPGFFGKLGRARTYGGRGLPRGPNLRVGTPGGALTHPWSSCMIGRAPRSCRCRAALRRLRAAPRDRQSGLVPRADRAGSQGTSCRAHHARRGARECSGAAKPACCRARYDGSGWTGARARCSGCQRGSSAGRRRCRASCVAPGCRAGVDAGDARLHARRHRNKRDVAGRRGLFACGATPTGAAVALDSGLVGHQRVPPSLARRQPLAQRRPP